MCYFLADYLKAIKRTFWWKRVIAFRQFLRTSPSSNYSWTSSPVMDFKTKQSSVPYFPSILLLLTLQQQQQWLLHGHHDVLKPQPFPSVALSLHIFPPSRWVERLGALLPLWALFFGPILALHWCAAAVSKSSPWFWSSSFFIPLFSLLFWAVGPPRTPQTWRWSLFKALI